MTDKTNGETPDWIETKEWVDALRDVSRSSGPARASRLLQTLQVSAQRLGVTLPVTSRTPYVNTIPAEMQPRYPGDIEFERRVKSIIRWNALAMVSDANDNNPGIGGHISTYASAATLYEVGFNHFFRGPDHECGGDLVYFQGHASPGMYARAYLEGRLTPKQLHNFRQEFAEGGGLSSYPHPWLMPDFWQFPTVSMGLSPIMAIYQARYLKYLQARGLTKPNDQRVWCFLGDGETDEPESLGAISLAARERLDNLIFVVNCNLQRLDGPVRGNGQIIQELEAVFRGVGWNVIKVLWGSDWDPLLAQDTDGRLADRMGEVVDGEYQKYTVAGGTYIREHFWGVDPRLARMVQHMSDEELWHMRLGGHDSYKVCAAYRAAVENKGTPTVILARTIKGYGLGEAGEGRNITHQQKHLNTQELLSFRDRFHIPLSDDEVVAGAPLYRPDEDSAEIRYMKERRQALGGWLPQRRVGNATVEPPSSEAFAEFLEGSGEREASTTMVLVRLMAALMRDKKIGKQFIPIVPDEARTFGMDSFFRSFGIYSSMGQTYEPVDAEHLLYYREAKDGQVIEEGITEAGSMSSFIAAGTSAMTTGVTTIPLFIFYSMFGMQRIGDLVWAASDARTRGFLCGGTSGRTTLNGEGLQHQDGHSHVLASVVPTMRAYDPAYAYEIAVILEEGIREMFVEGEERMYYLTVGNENYIHPPMPEGEGIREGIMRGMYKFRSIGEEGQPRVNLLGSGAILNEVLKGQEILAEKFGIASDVWSVTSWTELRRDGIEVERWNVLHAGEPERKPYIVEQLGDQPNLVVAASDFMKALPDGIGKWINARLVALGTDGFGRSDTRSVLRDFFEIDSRHVAFAALSALVREEAIPASVVKEAAKTLEIDLERPNPSTV